MSQAKGSVYAALNRSVKAAAAAGRIDLDAQAALVAAARKVARVMDEPGWPVVGGRFDNVSPSMLLKYCDALGIAPDGAPAKPARSALDGMRGTVKVMRLRA